jgi:hypothetical protein
MTITDEIIARARECWVTTATASQPHCFVVDGERWPAWLPEGERYFSLLERSGAFVFGDSVFPLHTEWALCPRHHAEAVAGGITFGE